jgi:hypothetical protein
MMCDWNGIGLYHFAAINRLGSLYLAGIDSMCAGRVQVVPASRSTSAVDLAE